ncbi:Small heat shock protein, chloroplastic [Ancistrocladus abbreviatus]
MASFLALRRLAGSSLFNNLHRPIRSLSVAPSITRSFNTNTQMTGVDEDDRDLDSDRRSDRVSRRSDMPGFLSDNVFDPFSPSRSVSQLMNLMDQLMDNPFTSTQRGMGIGGRRGWDIKEDENALYLRMDVPGLGREDVKVYVEENTLIIKGEGEKETEDEQSRRRYSTRIGLTPNLYKIDGIKAEMKNGVLKVVIPRVKEDERKDVFQVNVE